MSRRTVRGACASAAAVGRGSPVKLLPSKVGPASSPHSHHGGGGWQSVSFRAFGRTLVLLRALHLVGRPLQRQGLVLPGVSRARVALRPVRQVEDGVASEDVFSPEGSCCVNTETLQIFCKTKTAFAECPQGATPCARHPYTHIHGLVWGESPPHGEFNALQIKQCFRERFSWRGTTVKGWRNMPDA